MTNPRTALGLLLALLVAGGVGTTWWWLQDPGPVELLVAVDAEHAVVLRFREDRGPFADRATVALHRADGRRLWRRDLPRADRVRNQVAVVPQADRVVVRTTVIGEPAVFSAFSLQTGAPAWTWRNPEPYRNPVQRHIWEEAPSNLPEGRVSGQLVAFFGAGGLVVALDPEQGAELGRVEVSSGAHQYHLAEDEVVVMEDGRRMSRYRVTAEGLQVHATPVATCPVGAGWLRPLDADNWLSPREPGHLLEEPGHAGRPVTGLPEPLYASLCGLREGRLVVVERHPSRPDGSFVAVFDEALREPAVTFLEGLTSGLAGMFDAPTQFDGALPRHVFLLLRASEGTVLTALDLDEAGEAWRSPPLDELLHATVFGVDGRVYLVSRGLLARLDPHEGQVAHAVTLPEGQRVRPHQVRDGRVWVPSARGFLVLDGDTLEVRSSHRAGAEPEPATAEVRAWLGRPP